MNNHGLSIIEDAYYHKILSVMKGDEALRGYLMRIGDALGIKRPKHLCDIDTSDPNKFWEKLSEASCSMQSVLDGKVPRHNG